NKIPNSWKRLIEPEDTVRSLEVSPDTELGGDLRLHSLRAELPVQDSTGRKYFLENEAYASNKRVVHGLRTSSSNAYYNDDFANAYGRLVKDCNYTHNASGPASMRPNLSSRYNGVFLKDRDGALKPGDWDTGVGPACDGAFINKADDGQVDVKGYENAFRYPYFSEQQDPPGPTFFTPNRLVTSPVLFGSLSSGSFTKQPWQTLLFCPNPAAGLAHPGFGTTSLPPDHLLLDLFQMPVVEPYAVSEPLSTAGRVNLNYQMLPFTYLHRDTAMRAVLKGSRVPVIAGNAGNSYKGNATLQTRYPIDLEETLKGFEERFADKKDSPSGNTFRSASEICEMYMVPQGQKLNNMPSYWTDVAKTGLTGDNLRERPYAEIYPRITTKSNTYTVHLRVQTLRQAGNVSPTVWVEGRDQVLAEYRGSSTIERYVDPHDRDLPDYAATGTAQAGIEAGQFPIDQYYKFRVIATKRFQP
ncbi:MAG: Verru_Chthon cassette protein A, partial [Verrucomicrobiota bacterium]|nr:Verru_Chthon cassette protein A [Verrucomicrobiota bacterium]